MEKVVNDLIYELFLKSPLFWIIMILAVIIFFFWKKIAGKTGEFWTKKEFSAGCKVFKRGTV